MQHEELTNDGLMELETTGKGKGIQEEDGTKELKGFTTQEMTRDFLLLLFT